MTTPQFSAPPSGTPAASPPGRGLGYAVMAAAVVVTGILLVALTLAGSAAEQFEEQLRAGGSTFDVYTTYDLVGTFLIPTQVVALVLTGLWLLRLRRFGERVRPHYHHARRRWWAFGGWIVPIVSFWFPYQYVRDVRASLHPAEWRPSGLVGWWWTAFLAMAILDRVTARVSLSSDPDVVSQLPIFATALALVGVVALVLWLVLVRELLRAVDEVPDDVLRSTAFAADPAPYDPAVAPPGAPIYGPPHG
jgi:hypothetical protein